MQLLLITVLGVGGVLSRYFLDRGSIWICEIWELEGFWRIFPWMTGIVNIVGSFAIGYVMGLGENKAISPTLQTAITVGFLGGFTTFSAYSWQVLMLMERNILS